ncbi:MAG: helix-turn-helix domain-containing protein [Pyrinomonadaceae bacterium]
MEPVSQELLPQKAAAKYLGVSVTSYWRLRKSGEIKIVRIGNKANVRKSDLDEFIERQYLKTNGEECPR